jgi:PAS domain S-box-containing protein
MFPEFAGDPGSAFSSPILPVAEEATFLRLFDAATVPLALIDDARHLTRVNRAWTELLGYTSAQAMTMRVDEIVAPGHDSGAAVSTDFRAAVRPTRLGLVRADGERIEVRFGRLGRVIKGSHLLVFATQEARRASAGRPPVRGGRRRSGQLTRREQESLRLVARGMTTTVAAKQLGISPETVRTHVRNAMNKLGARTRAQAIAVAIRDGEISD